MDEIAIAAAPAAQYLTFTLAEQAYGIGILDVQEIKGLAPITPVPNTPPHVCGVMNLRGAIIPVVDLRRKFGLPPAHLTAFSVIIVVKVGPRVVGLFVDAVSDVLAVAPDQLQQPPDLGGGGAFVAGMVLAGDQLVTLLDVETLLAADVAPLAQAS